MSEAQFTQRSLITCFWWDVYPQSRPCSVESLEIMCLRLVFNE